MSDISCYCILCANEMIKRISLLEYVYSDTIVRHSFMFGKVYYAYVNYYYNSFDEEVGSSIYWRDSANCDTSDILNYWYQASTTHSDNSLIEIIKNFSYRFESIEIDNHYPAEIDYFFRLKSVGVFDSLDIYDDPLYNRVIQDEILNLFGLDIDDMLIDNNDSIDDGIILD